MRAIRAATASGIALALGAGLPVVPAAAHHGQAETRIVSRSVVHAGPSGASIERPTSFEIAAPLPRREMSLRGVAASGPSSPSSLFGFDALADLDDAIPSDTVGALGDTVYVTAVNSSIGIFSAVDGSAVFPRTALASMSPVGPGLLHFDPKVVYDQYADTFVVVWLGFDESPRRSFILATAIPDATATDTSTWCVTAFAGDQVPGDGELWADYPGLGYNQDRVTITTNQFTFVDDFRYSQVMTIDKLALYDCSQPEPVPVVFAGSATTDRRGLPAFTIQPAQTVGAATGAQLLVSFQCFPLSCFRRGVGRSSYLTLWRIQPTASGFALKKGSVATGKVALPLLGTQAGGFEFDLFWDAGDERLINLFHDSDTDRLYTAHAVRRNLKPDTVTGSYPETAIRWYEVDPAGRLGRSTILRKGVVGAPEVDSGWPSVATDAAGNLFVTFSRASAPLGEFLSAWVAEIHPGTTSAALLLLRSGVATYDVVPGPERWGDYTGINRDPSSPSVMATFNQYAASSTTWQQVVHAVSHV